MSLKQIITLISLLLIYLNNAHAEEIVAPNLQARPLSQLSAHSSACGPVCLMNSLRLGSKKWQQYDQLIVGKSDKARIFSLLKTYGAKPSSSLKNQSRWQTSSGVNPIDLTQIANEITPGIFTPKIKLDTLILKEGENYELLLQRVHKKLTQSFKKGFPPILGVTRYVQVNQHNGITTWLPLKAHYIVITKLEDLNIPNKKELLLSYIDPWGAERLEGKLESTDLPFFKNQSKLLKFPQLTVSLPESGIGRQAIKKGQKSLILVTSAIGAF